MNSPAYDIAQILDSSGVSAGDYTTDLVVSQMPDTPNNCICVYDTGGFDSAADYVYDRPTVMVKVRNLSYRAGYAKAQLIKSALHGLSNENWGSSRYIGIWCMGDINSVGLDENQRQIFTVNFRIHRTTT
jgi:hypothetical protein